MFFSRGLLEGVFNAERGLSCSLLVKREQETEGMSHAVFPLRNAWKRPQRGVVFMHRHGGLLASLISLTKREESLCWAVLLPVHGGT